MTRKNPADDKGYYYETGAYNSYGTPQRVYLADPEDAVDGQKSGYSVFVFQFGAYGDTRVAVAGQRGLEGAMDVAGQWLEDHAPGIFTDIKYPPGINSMDDDELYRAMEEAERDMTNFSTDGGSQWWVPSWEWSFNEYARDELEWEQVHTRLPRRRSKNPAHDGGRAKRMMNPQNY